MNEQLTKGLIFDLDGTLYRLGFMKFRMAMSLLGSLTLLRKLFPALNIVREQKFSSRGDLLKKLYGVLSEMTHHREEQVALWYQERFMNAFVRMLARSAEARFGVRELLASARKNEVKTAVVSDFSHVPERLRAIGLNKEMFDIVACSEQYGALKPSPVSVLAVAEQMELKPAEVMIIGDRDDMDGECARRAGMSFVGIKDDKNKNEENFYFWNEALQKIAVETNLELNL